MPPSGFIPARPFDPERVGAVAIYCSDGRYNEQFDEFLHEHLNLPRYDRLVIPGAPPRWRATSPPTATRSN